MVHDVGLIGLGAMGATMLDSLAAHPRFRAVLAWDPQGEACKQAKAGHPDLEIADSAEALIEDPRISIVYIASPPASHAAYLRAAAAAGKKVYCEKPLGVDIAESEVAVAAVEAAGLANAINFNHGNALASTRVEAALRSSEAGAVAKVDIFIHVVAWPRPFQSHAAWLAGRAQGGFTREMISHWLYLTRRLLGEGRILWTAPCFPAEPDLAETRLLAELDFGGVPVAINAACGGAGPIGTEYTLWGARRSFRLHSGGGLLTSDGGPWLETLAEIEDIGAEDKRRNLEAAALRFDGAASPLPELKDGLAVQRLIEALLEEKMAPVGNR